MYGQAGDTDIPDIVDLMNRAYRGNTGSSWTTEVDYLEGNRTTEILLRDDIARTPSASFLKWQDESDGRMIGCVWLEPVKGSLWYLGSLAIDPIRQNGGLGRTLLQAAETWAADHGATRIRMSVVNIRETLIAWYLRRGYVRTGETEPFPYDDNRFGTPLRKDLCFVILEKDLEIVTADKPPVS